MIAIVCDQNKRIVRIKSDAQEESFVTLVQALDADRGLNAALTYSIAAGNGGGVFHIDERTGVVTIARRKQAGEEKEDINDDEKSKAGGVTISHLLTIVVRDNGVPPLSSVVQLTIEQESVDAAGMLAASSGVKIPGSGAGGLISGSVLIMIIGVVAGVVLVLTVILITVIICRRRHIHRLQHKSAHPHLSACTVSQGESGSMGRGRASGGGGEDDVTAATLVSLYADMTRSMDLARNAYISRELNRSRLALECLTDPCEVCQDGNVCMKQELQQTASTNNYEVTFE